MSETRIVELIETRGTARRVRLEDGTVVDRRGGSASWRNNNPGNLKLEYAGSTDKTSHARRSYQKALGIAQRTYQGVIALDQWGNAVFETPEAGRAAQLKLLRRSHSSHTVEQMVRGYSRADYSGGTHHDAQVRSIYRTADAAGVDLRGKTIGAMTASELDALADGIGHFEGFKVGRVAAVPSIGQVAHEEARPVVAPAHASSQRRAQAGVATTPSHRTLHPGDHGHAVRELQKALNRIGCTDARGQRLVEDGRFGTHTRDALASFQRAHGLPATGIAGVRTAQVLREEDGRLVTSPAHPDHRLFEEVLKRLHAAESARGTPSGPHAVRVAAALVVEMRRDGVARADRVELNRDGSLVRAVQVSGLRDEPGLNRMTRAVDVGHAAQQSLRDSSARLVAVDVELRPAPPLRVREQPALVR